MVFVVAVAVSSAAALGFLAQDPDPPAPPPPEVVTRATRADEDALRRLQRPGRVLFVDGFESEETFGRYFEVGGAAEGRVAIERDPDLVHTGRGALRLVSTDRDGAACGAGPVLWLGSRDPAQDGHDVLHVRYRIRYAEDYDQGDLHHTGVSISGVAGSGKWSGMGTAGQRPRGDDHFSVRVEGWRDWKKVAPPGFLYCYAYWMDMRRSRDGNYWGNMIQPALEDRRVPARGTWGCVELRVAANTPGEADGELAVWLDGELYLHAKGIRWRSSRDVRCKRVHLLCYVHEARRDNRVWYDDLVVSTGYVGTGEVGASGSVEDVGAGGGGDGLRDTPGTRGRS